VSTKNLTEIIRVAPRPNTAQLEPAPLSLRTDANMSQDLIKTNSDGLHRGIISSKPVSLEDPTRLIKDIPVEKASDYWINSTITIYMFLMWVEIFFVLCYYP
jgi:hypothetical protein